MSDVRHVLSDLVDDAQIELDRAVRHLDSVTILHELAWSIETDQVLDVDDVPRRLAPIDAARWRVAMAAASDTFVELEDDPDDDVVGEDLPEDQPEGDQPR